VIGEYPKLINSSSAAALAWSIVASFPMASNIVLARISENE
jgi:hypothetical protein